MTTDALATAIKTQERLIATATTVIAAYEALQAVDAFVQTAFPQATLNYTSGWSGSPSLHLALTVHDLPVEMAAHLAAWEAFGVPLEAWTTHDCPEERRRSFWSDSCDAAPCNIFFNAVLSDDSTCRIEVVGYTETEVYEQVLIKKSTPIMHLVCPEGEGV
jgi:hypothetical protein